MYVFRVGISSFKKLTCVDEGNFCFDAKLFVFGKFVWKMLSWPNCEMFSRFITPDPVSPTSDDMA